MSSDYSFKKFQKCALIRLLGMDKYNEILNMFNNENIDLSKSKDEFQKCFNSFYKIRRNNEWRKYYYDYFQENRNNKNITFDEILDYMYDKTGQIEASFASKMLATINPDMPIWDQYVLKNLGLKVQGITKEEKIKSTKDVYKKMICYISNNLREENIKKTIKDFKEFFSEFAFSDTKIFDFILWNDR